ncbi:hypothetical protein Cri9333_3221 [Crinalium epipsammum PCC 9333]|uniref:Peptide chain release factor 1 n=1 Tax=Crinalium epipsammum PCC 9333 TaxID=1173022 RepID=K9W2P1_9CYAN|nr:hypothetical protein [Crinalium epipsammum]AFZ14054.1 hypothetical protein Cri9333_3221 [Crinalium epipsammum PCC 9333]
MRDPLRRLKNLPWRALLQVSVLTNLIVLVLDFLIWREYQRSPVVRQALIILYTPPLEIITTLTVAVGVGALAVYLLERFYPQIRLEANTLWALVPCLALIIFLKSLLPLPSILLSFNEVQVMAIIIGIFWKSQRYWR